MNNIVKITPTITPILKIFLNINKISIDTIAANINTILTSPFTLTL